MIVTFEVLWSEISRSEGIPFELMLKQNFENQNWAGDTLKLTFLYYHYSL